jgi:hypothetical protein
MSIPGTTNNNRRTTVVFTCSAPFGLKIGCSNNGHTIVTGYHQTTQTTSQQGPTKGPGQVCQCAGIGDVVVQINGTSTYNMDHDMVKRTITRLKGPAQKPDGSIALTFASFANRSNAIVDQQEWEAPPATPSVDARLLYQAYLDRWHANQAQQQAMALEVPTQAASTTTTTTVLRNTPSLSSRTLPATAATLPPAPPLKSMLEQCHDALQYGKFVEGAVVGQDVDGAVTTATTTTTATTATTTTKLPLDTKTLSSLVYQHGVPGGEIGLRSTVWRVLLDHLPTDKAQWVSELHQKRTLYFAWCDGLYPKDARRRRSCGDKLPPRQQQQEQQQQEQQVQEEDSSHKIDPLSPTLDQAWSTHWNVRFRGLLSGGGQQLCT